MKRRIIALCMALCCALLLFGCSAAKTVKSEQEIMADLQEKGVIADNPGAKITALEILKRQTNAEDKQDIVYVTIQAEADTAKYVRSYQVEYGLYDEGWVLDNVSCFEEGENKIIPLTEPGSAELDMFFQNVNDEINAHNAKYADEDEDYIISNPPYSSWEITNQETNAETGRAIMHVQASRETPFLITHETMVLPWTFCEDGQWHVLQIDITSVNDAIQSFALDWSKLTSIELPNRNQYGVSVTLDITDTNYSNNTISVDYSWFNSSNQKGNSYTGIIQYQTKYDLSDYQSCRDKIQRDINEYNAEERSDKRRYGRQVGDDFAPLSSTSLYLLSECKYFSDDNSGIAIGYLIMYSYRITASGGGWDARDYA